MLGTAMLRTFAQSQGYLAIGAVRSTTPKLRALAPEAHLVDGLDAESADSLARVFVETQPDVVINAVGLIKQLAGGNAVSSAVPINTLLPHRLQRLTKIAGARLVHISTDCVFSGSRGGYREIDKPDATDVYGLSKLLGEVDGDNAVTLRTSIIGHELMSRNGLIEWFLGQDKGIKGFTKSIFSGLPTMELARVVRNFVLPHPDLTGLYHVSAEPISKYDLLCLVGELYGHTIDIEPDASLVIDRSLNSDRFRRISGYAPPSWHELIAFMRSSRIESK